MFFALHKILTTKSTLYFVYSHPVYILVVQQTQGFCNSGAQLQSSTEVLRLNCYTKLKICVSIAPHPPSQSHKTLPAMPMTASVYSNTTLIGHTDLQVGDESMGSVFGDFIPTENYYKFVQKSVWDVLATTKPGYKKWHSLNINVQLENGYFLYPIGGYTFDDAEEFPDETKRIDIAGLFRHVIEDFFLTEPSRPFVEESWERITIEQKILFDTELQREIKRTSNSLFGIIKSTSKHTLADYKCSAVCKNGQADDILFSIHNTNRSDKCYALVHLTFSGKTEDNTAFPLTTLFDSFDAFKFERMYPDKAEGED